MTRSNWASWEQSRGSVGTVASDCAVRAEFEDRTHRERMRPRPLVSSTNHLLKLILASSLVVAAVPNSAHAESVGGKRHADQPSSRSAPGSPRDTPAAGVVLALGSGYSNRRDAARVQSLQRHLARGGFAPGPTDGLFGPLTERAVDRFQTAHGLPADGIAGPVTLAALGHPPAVLLPGLGFGRRGSVPVRALQRQLARAGYSPGPIDGRYGPRTERAVVRYQAANGLQVDGIAGRRTLAALSHVKAPGRHRGAHHARPSGAHHHAGRGRNRPRRPAQRAHARPPRAPTKRSTPRTEHSSRSPSAGLVLLLIALALALGLTAIWAANRRREVAGGSGTDQSAAEPVASPLPAATPGPVNERAARQPEPKPKLEPDDASDAEWLFRHALVFDREGDVEQAIQAYAEADRLGHAAAACNLGVLLERHGDIGAASAAFRRADERGNADGAFNLAFRLEEQGDLIGAAEAYHRADQLGHAAAASNLGIMLEQRGDRTGAMAAFARAVQRGDSAGAFNLAVLLEEQGDRVAAIRTYERAARLGDGAAAERARAAALELKSKLANKAATREGGGGNGP